MKALVKTKPGKGLWMEEVPVPEPGINDVMIKIRKTAICGKKNHKNTDDNWSRICGSGS